MKRVTLSLMAAILLASCASTPLKLNGVEINRAQIGASVVFVAAAIALPIVLSGNDEDNPSDGVTLLEACMSGALPPSDQRCLGLPGTPGS